MSADHTDSEAAGDYRPNELVIDTEKNPVGLVLTSTDGISQPPPSTDSEAAGDYRPIEEIIGWEMMLSPATGSPVWRHPSSETFGSPSPTVDDLLAWLHNNEWWTDLLWMRSAGQFGWRAIADREDESHEFPHPDDGPCSLMLETITGLVREVANNAE